MEKDSADNVRHELDDQFAALRELIYAPDLQSSIDGTAKSPTAGKDDKEPPEKLGAVTDTFTIKLLPPVDDYDHRVRELAFDKRAKPKDRTKTDEELALEAKEALEGAERKRRRRMLGLPESDSEDETRKGKRKRGPDDLDDDFDQDLGEYEDLGVGLEGGPLREEEGDDGGGDSELEFSEEASEVDSQDESLGDEDEEEGDDDDDEGEEQIDDLVPSMQTVRVKSKGKKKEELPFTFPCPENHGEFLEIVEGLELADVCIVVQRLRTLYHASLAPDNKFKLQVCKYRCASLSPLLNSPPKRN